MCRRFLQLSYGEGNWKAHIVATLNYSSWYSKHIRHAAKIKIEPGIKKEKETAKQSGFDESLGSLKHKKVKIDVFQQVIDMNMINVDDDTQPARSPILLKNPLSIDAISASSTATHSGTSTTAAELLLMPKPTVAKPSKKAKAGHTLNAKSLCKHKWITLNPNGTKDNFATYWAGLGPEGQSVFEKRICKQKAQLKK
ncbi:hypothetical protein H0H92_016143 [Tricholoma furcatifolium]|nr:hypothetical protein H0H92_016143 [Tricholoma furcatifolium]